MGLLGLSGLTRLLGLTGTLVELVIWSDWSMIYYVLLYEVALRQTYDIYIYIYTALHYMLRHRSPK